MNNDENSLPPALTPEQKALLKELRALWRNSFTKSYTVGFTIADTSVDLAGIANLMVYPRRDGIYQVEVGEEGLAILEGMEAAGRIKALPDLTLLKYSSGLITPIAFITRSPDLDLSAVPGLRIRPHTEHAGVVCGELVGDGGMEALKEMQDAHLISMPS